MSGHLPMSRIKTIIKSSADVDVVGKESIYLITRAAELFIKHLARDAFKDIKKGKKLDYKNVANVVNSNSHYEFLHEMIPNKITVREYYALMKKEGMDVVNEDSSSEDSSGSNSNTDESSVHEDENIVVSSDSDVVILE